MGETLNTNMLLHLEPWQVFALTASFSTLSALLRALVDSARKGIWRKVGRVASSAFWGGMAAILLSEWLKLAPQTLVVVGALFGWVGYEATVSTLLGVLERKIGIKDSESKPKT